MRKLNLPDMALLLKLGAVKPAAPRPEGLSDTAWAQKCKRRAAKGRQNYDTRTR